MPACTSKLLKLRALPNAVTHDVWPQHAERLPHAESYIMQKGYRIPPHNAHLVCVCKQAVEDSGLARGDIGAVGRPFCLAGLP